MPPAVSRSTEDELTSSGSIRIISPVIRLLLLVANHGHLDYVLVHSIEDGEMKAMEDDATELSHRRRAMWKSAQLPPYPPHLGSEAASKPGADLTILRLRIPKGFVCGR
jgi:hypothetical protein